MSGIRIPSSGIVGNSGTAAVLGSTAFLSFVFTTGAGATTVALGGTHDTAARATPNRAQVVIFRLTMMNSRNLSAATPRRKKAVCESPRKAEARERIVSRLSRQGAADLETG